MINYFAEIKPKFCYLKCPNKRSNKSHRMIVYIQMMQISSLQLKINLWPFGGCVIVVLVSKGRGHVELMVPQRSLRVDSVNHAEKYFIACSCNIMVCFYCSKQKQLHGYVNVHGFYINDITYSRANNIGAANNRANVIIVKTQLSKALKHEVCEK